MTTIRELRSRLADLRAASDFGTRGLTAEEARRLSDRLKCGLKELESLVEKVADQLWRARES